MNSRTEEAVGLSSLKAELLNYSKFDLAFLLDEAGPTPLGAWPFSGPREHPSTGMCFSKMRAEFRGKEKMIFQSESPKCSNPIFSL